jgi:hypothetical protein
MWDHNHDFPIQIRCDHCGGENVTRDGAARWNKDTQRWELTTVFDNADCEDCGGETRLVERKMDGTPVTIHDTFHKEND